MIAQAEFTATDDPDAALMVRVREGDLSAFNELMILHEARVVRIISHLMGSSADAEDLAQQVFLRAFRARKTYVPCARFVTWLSRITRNVVLTARRKQAQQRERLRPTFERVPDGRWLSDRISSDLDPSDEVVRSETCHQVRFAIEMLSQREQDAVRLVCLEGHSFKSAAKQLGTSDIAVKSLVCRARGKLRTSLAHRVG
jgi:RNA polymerase sigma-70 factor (ECF subfamily)